MPTKKSKSPSRVKSSMILRSSSPEKKSTTRRRTACGVKNGKVTCSVVDAAQVTGEFVGKQMEAKRKFCNVAAEMGVGVCDEEGNLFHYEDENPVVHEEMDSNGNIVRHVLIEPKVIFVADTNFTNFDALARFPGLEKKLVHPDKLKLCYMSTREEIKAKNNLFKYLTCLTMDTPEAYSQIPSGCGFSSDFSSLSKSILRYNILSKVSELLANFTKLSDEEKKNINRQIRLSANRTMIGNTSFISDENFYYRKAQYTYAPGKTVTVKLPPALSDALSHKLALNKLSELIGEGVPTQADTQKMIEWIKILLRTKQVLGPELTTHVQMMLLVSGGITAQDLSLNEEGCRTLLQQAERQKLIVSAEGRLPQVMARTSPAVEPGVPGGAPSATGGGI